MDGVDPRLEEIKDCLYRVATKAIIVDDGKLLLVRDNGDDYWGLPGGGIDYGEEIMTAFKRELKEEIGLDEPHIKKIDGPVLVSTDGIVDGVPRINIYYKVAVYNEHVVQGDDVDEVMWCPAEKLLSLPFSPSIVNNLPEISKFLL